MNRRDFFLPRHLLRAAGQISGLVDALARPLELQAPVDPEASLLRFSRPAMATTFEILVPFDMPNAAAMATRALDIIDQLECQMTVYQPESEVSRINDTASLGPVPVEPELFSLFERAVELTRQTAGAFDIFAGALSKAWGFFRRQGQVPEPDALIEVMECVGMRHVALDDNGKTICFSRPGVEINLGSIGKGHALDRAAAIFRREREPRSPELVPPPLAALLHGGHSSVLALGSQPGRRDGWPVGIRHPERGGERLLILNLRDRALGTSAATYQHLQYNGRRLGHILDPRTGWPAEGVLSASATAPTAAEADALATAFFILGADGTREYCECHPEIGAVLMLEGESCPLLLGRARDELPPA
ncbi:MAG: FAD:protein FMN transferase [Planctomycetes bacterium]|nr:FAD:protein FMN transferase [Planctomycetota bacterium]